MVNYENDYIWGEQQQQKIFTILEAKWKGLRPQGRYAKYDAVNETTNIEIKSRKNSYNAYPTTLLTLNKISDTSKTNIFVFNFVKEDQNEIYYIEYDEEKFKMYERRMFSRAKFKADEKEYIYIPIKDLILLDDEWIDTTVDTTFVII